VVQRVARLSVKVQVLRSPQDFGTRLRRRVSASSSTPAGSTLPFLWRSCSGEKMQR